MYMKIIKFFMKRNSDLMKNLDLLKVIFHFSFCILYKIRDILPYKILGIIIENKSI